MRGKGFLCKGIELSVVRVALDGYIEPISLEGLVPRTKTGQLSRVQLLDSLFDVFGGGHIANIAPQKRPEKVGLRRGATPARPPAAARR